MNFYLSVIVALLMTLSAHDEQRKRRSIFIDQGLVTTIDQRPAHASAEISIRKDD